MLQSTLSFLKMLPFLPLHFKANSFYLRNEMLFKNCFKMSKFEVVEMNNYAIVFDREKYFPLI